MRPYAKNICAILLPATCFVLAGGCATLDEKLHRDIVRVSRYYNKQSPWINFDDPPSKGPGGIRMVVYLKSSKGHLGVFGDGTIHVNLYHIEKGPDGETVENHLKRWSFDAEQAVLYHTPRVRLGRGYQLRLNWGDADILGKEAMFTVSFERYDGRVIHGQSMYLKVPRRV